MGLNESQWQSSNAEISAIEHICDLNCLCHFYLKQEHKLKGLKANISVFDGGH